jgi:hypothetical protein
LQHYVQAVFVPIVILLSYGIKVGAALILGTIRDEPNSVIETKQTNKSFSQRFVEIEPRPQWHKDPDFVMRKCIGTQLLFHQYIF